MYPLTAMLAFALTRGFYTATPDELLRHSTPHRATGRAQAPARANESHLKRLRVEGDEPAASWAADDTER